MSTEDTIALIVCGILGLLVFIFSYFFSDREKDKKRGATFATKEDLKNLNLLEPWELDDPKWRDQYYSARKPGLPIGWFCTKKTKKQVTYKGENHLITVGKPGSGKGTTIILPTLLQYPGSCIVVDPKGENIAVSYRARLSLGNEIIFLNPYGLFSDDQDFKSSRYNPLDALDPKSANFVGDVGSMAGSLIYQSSKETHFSDSARELVSALIMYTCFQDDKDKRNLVYVRYLLTREGDELTNVLHAMAGSDYYPLSQKIQQFTKDSKEIHSIISTARTQTAFLDDPCIADSLSYSDFSFKDLKRKKMSVFISLPAKHLQSQARWMRLLVTAAIDEMTDVPKKGDGRVLFMLDEFAQLGRLEAIERSLALVRGYGIQLWPFIQDLPQLKSVYPDRWESFLATAGIQQFFTPNDQMTAKYISERTGNALRKRTTRTKNDNSESVSESEHWESLVNEWEVYGESFTNNSSCCFIEGLSRAAFLSRTSYRYLPEIYSGPNAPMENPYHF